MKTTAEHTSLIGLMATLFVTNVAIAFTVIQYGLAG